MIGLVQDKLLAEGYKKIGVNYAGVALYCKPYADICYVINVVDYNNPQESPLTTEALLSLNQSTIAFMNSKGFENVEMLTLIVTYSEYLAEDLADSRMDYWVLDSYHNQFIIPYGQPQQFDKCADIFQKIVDELNGITAVEVKVPEPSRRVEVTRRPSRRLFIINNLFVAINVIIFFWLESKGNTTNSYFMLDHGAFFWPSIKIHGEIYRFFTCIFIHFGFEHLLSNMIVLFFLGDNLERAIGKSKYVIIYLVTGLAGSIVSCIYYLIIDEYVLSGGASGAIFGVLGALLYVVWTNQGKLEDLSSFKLILFLSYSFYNGFNSTGVDNAAHVGGFFAGLVLGKLLYRKPEQTLPY